MKKENILKELIIIFWLFIIGSMVGCLVETIVALVQKGFLETRKGLIYGPFIPVYGAGIVIYYIVLNNINTENKVKVFFITALLGGIIEYLFSFLQEKMFGTISWNYSNLMFNINGRTSLLHCTYWGLAGVLYATVIEPLIEKSKKDVNNNFIKTITLIFAIFIIFDIIISCMAAQRQEERRKNIKPETKIDSFLDKHYPDEYMDNIYTNKKDVICE